MQALQIAREINYAELLFAASRDLGTLLCQLGQKEQGLPLLELALAVGLCGKPSANIWDFSPILP